MFCCNTVKSTENYHNSKFIKFGKTRELCATRLFSNLMKNNNKLNAVKLQVKYTVNKCLQKLNLGHFLCTLVSFSNCLLIFCNRFILKFKISA